MKKYDQKPLLDTETIQLFQRTVLDWYGKHARDLPWRKTQDPYKIWISESMLCQTQVSRVISYYESRIKLFPTVSSLASASNKQVLKARSGLGYNSRAIRLKQAAERIVYEDRFPDTYEMLVDLPGVGDYVANAILAFAFNQDVVVLDTNIRRIMMHEFVHKAKISTFVSALTGGGKPQEKLLKQLVWETLPSGKARVWYNALMDYGALELTSAMTGIKPLSKQSRFQGSSRQVRAGILRGILRSTEGVIDLDTLQAMFPERSDLDQIILKMIEDKLIIRRDKVLLISE